MGESGNTLRRQRLPGAQARIAIAIATLALAAGVYGCGSSGERQDVTEPEGNFPVQVVRAKFPNRQRLAETSDLQLEIRNTGNQTIPHLAVTIYTGDIKAGVSSTGSGQGSFNIHEDNPALADPNRPVWILENDYPKLLGPGITVKNLDRAPSAGASAAQTDTFQFGALPPNESKAIDWRVTPVRKGTFTVHYQVSAGLTGKAKAVTADGSPVKGEFVVTISARPPQTCVSDSGQVTTNCGP